MVRCDCRRVEPWFDEENVSPSETHHLFAWLTFLFLSKRPWGRCKKSLPGPRLRGGTKSLRGYPAKMRRQRNSVAYGSSRGSPLPTPIPFPPTDQYYFLPRFDSICFYSWVSFDLQILRDKFFAHHPSCRGPESTRWNRYTTRARCKDRRLPGSSSSLPNVF